MSEIKEDAAKDYQIEFPNAGKEIDLKPMHDALIMALFGFIGVCHEIRETFLKTNESLSVMRLSDFSKEMNVVTERIAEIESYTIGDVVQDGIRCPTAKTMYLLDGHLEETDKSVVLCNSNAFLIFKAIKDGMIAFQDIKDYEIFYKNLYLKLCEYVLKYYNSVIIAIGDKADFAHSNECLIEYFQKKNIKDGTNNYPLIPATKNMFGELIHSKATGTTITQGKTTRQEFNQEIQKRQAKNKLLQNPA